MRIAFDLHGTLDDSQDIFKPMLSLLLQSGVNVSVISGPPVLEIALELEKFGYICGKHFNNVYSIVGELKTTDVKMWQDENDEWWSDDVTWWSSKGIICKKYNIDVLVDNEARYKPYLSPGCKFLHWERSRYAY